jgi:hypothetical protein
MAAKKKLSPEVLAKLNGYGMATGVANFTPKIVVGKEDIVSEEGITTGSKDILLEKKYCPTFQIQLPTNKEWKATRKMVKEVQAEEGGKIDEEEMLITIVSKAVVGWKNYMDITTGEEIEFDKELIEEIPQKLQKEIFFFITETSGLY